jgi:hypothetical protein
MSSPRVVTDAMLPDVHRLPGGLALRPLSIAHTLLLQKIDSPFIAIDGETGAPANAAPPNELDALAVVYLLTRTDAEIDALFHGFERPAFAAAVWRFAKEQPPALLIGLDAKLTAIFQHATSTLIGGGEDEAPGANIKKNDLSELVGTGRDNGLGWTLTLVDTLLHEYGGLKLMDALRLHLARAFALYAAIAARYDHAPAGPTYEEAALLAQLGDRRLPAKPAWQA